MWAVMIIVGAPFHDHAAGMAQRREQVRVGKTETVFSAMIYAARALINGR